MFYSDRMETVSGVITRYNKKTVTVITDDGRRWNVSPGLLSKVISGRSQASVGTITPIASKR